MRRRSIDDRDGDGRAVASRRPRWGEAGRRTGTGWFGRIGRAGVVLILLMAGFVAFGLGRHWRLTDDRFQAPPLDHLLWWDSFSEVEQTKAVLRGLCLRSIAEIRRDYLRTRVQPGSSGEASEGWEVPDPALTRSIDRLRGRLAEFAGTDQANLIRSELMRSLRRAGNDAEWLGLYLELVYRWPQHEAIGSEAVRAMAVGRALGRELEVREALDHWRRIPARYLVGMPSADPVPAPATLP